jgi:NAD-dependent DNA ligase
VSDVSSELVSARHARLAAEILAHDRAYYVLSAPAITDLDWHFTIAHACIATALDMCNVPVDSSVTQKQAAT